MNKQISKLITQAGGHWNHGDFNMPSSVEFQEQDIEKFAELIVRECCDWIDGSPTSESGCQLLLTKSFIIANLKGHFGVEE